MNQLTLFGEDSKKFVNITQAAQWASKYSGRNITSSNISYLIQYGRIRKHGSSGNTLISIEELRHYYDSHDKEQAWKEKLGDDLNWHLSFVEYKESERTKHVHRLHPYKGKFIPQLVEYFLDSHTDEFKHEAYFHSGDIVLDPFCGSGTTLVQANELGIHAIGVDVSAFNAMITNAKVGKHDLPAIGRAIREITHSLQAFQETKPNIAFEAQLLGALARFNDKYFPSPDYRRNIHTGAIDEKQYSAEKEQLLLDTYYRLIERYDIQIVQDNNGTFLDKWFLAPVREEIDFVFGEIRKINNPAVKTVLAIILSRTIRSCRATTHADLGTLKDPVLTTYYCKKHGKMCKPIFSIGGWWQRYTTDTMNRLRQFDRLRTDTCQVCLTGDSRSIDIDSQLEKKAPRFAALLRTRKIGGIFSSPPYVGLIDYHEQHAYSYELFGFDRRDDLEIGPLSNGQGKQARDSYASGIADSLVNSKKYLQPDFDVFLVANDKFNLYPDIARMAGMEIVNRFKRPVLNRVEKDRSNAYSETIFHLKGV